jgi:hypothetical protein
VLGDVRATAVVELAGDREVVVAVDRRDLTLRDERADLVGVRAVPDEVTAADDPADPEPLDALERRLEGGEVGVDVGDDRDPALVPARDARARRPCRMPSRQSAPLRPTVRT